MLAKHALKGLGKRNYLAASILFITAAQAQGIEFYAGGVEANLDSQISIGSSWRMEEKDQAILNDPNINQGDDNYEKNDAFSQIFKGSHDLQINYENYGAFVRGKYWYDAALKNDDSLDDTGYHDLAKFSGAEILDAFAYASFDILDTPVDVRLGKQVVSWGESTFIVGSIDSINSFDLSAFNRPGAKIKEAVIPVNMAYINIGLSDNFSAEAFYQLEFRETVLDACGTYFSTLDFVSKGGTCEFIEGGDSSLSLPIVAAETDFETRPSADGQFGIALRYMSEELDTEFGFYAMNIHSRNPVLLHRQGSLNNISGLTAAFFDPSGASLAALNTTDTATYNAINDGVSAYLDTLGLSTDDAEALRADVAAASILDINTASTDFSVEYPEDMKIAGISFATTLGSVAVSGEISHQLDTPFLINSYQFTGGIVAAEFEQGLETLGIPLTNEYFNTFTDDNDGVVLDGFDLYDVSQAQLTAIQIFDQVLGASSVVFVGEVGYTYVHGFDENGVTRYDGSVTAAMTDTVTESAWGYRAIVEAEYPDAFSGVGLTPSLFVSQDVEGVASVLGSGFKEGNTRIGLSLGASYKNTYNGSISYTRLDGDENDSLSDRDYASVSIGMQF